MDEEEEEEEEVVADGAVFNGESDEAVPVVAEVVSPWTAESSDVDMMLHLLDNGTSNDEGEEGETAAVDVDVCRPDEWQWFSMHTKRKRKTERYRHDE